MEKTTEERIYELVKEQFGKMKMSKKYSNQARLYNACEHIIYHEWNMWNDNLSKLVDKYVEEFIPLEKD